jgi:hypothetical protein
MHDYDHFTNPPTPYTDWNLDGNTVSSIIQLEGSDKVIITNQEKWFSVFKNTWASEEEWTEIPTTKDHTISDSLYSVFQIPGTNLLAATYWWSWWDTTWKICLYEFSDPT